MMEIEHLILAWVTGFVSGFFISIPVGPIGIAIIHEGGERGFRWGLLIGLGAVTMETIYCTISFAGFSSLFDSRLLRAIMELASFLLVLSLGLRYLRRHHLPGTPRSVERMEERLHPHTAFMTGFVRVLGNPAVLLYWIALSATFLAHEWVAPEFSTKAACVAGVSLGAMTWFGILSYAVSIGHRHLSEQVLIRMTQFSGVFLLVVASIIGFRLIMLLRLAPH
jgi:threonine/homoserine/homoserine lactone efflux protein